MKRSALKSIPLALVPSRAKPVNHSKQVSNVTDYFDGWLQSVSPSAIEPKTFSIPRERANPGGRPLTQADLSRVILATVRESDDHRAWPPGVFEKFLQAEVIRSRRQ